MSRRDRIECVLLAIAFAGITLVAAERAIFGGESWGWLGMGISGAICGAMLGRALK